MLLFFFKTEEVLAQTDTIYSDENNRLISKDLFDRKMNSALFHGLRYETDTLVLNKIRFNYYFGELDPTIKSQLFKLLSKRNSVDTSKTLVIHYLDTLKSIEEFPKKTETVFFDSLNNEVEIPKFNNSYLDLTSLGNIKSHIHVKNYKTFVREYKRCIKKHKKYNETVDLLHFYGYSRGNLQEMNYGVDWLKDYGLVVKKVFSDGFKNFNIIILHPDGEFFMQSRYNKLSYENLLKRIHWEEYKAEFIRTLENI